MTADPLISLPGAAKHLGVSPNTLRALVKAGKLAHHLIGTRVKFRESDLEAYLAGVRIEAALVPTRDFRVRSIGRLDGKPLRW